MGLLDSLFGVAGNSASSAAPTDIHPGLVEMAMKMLASHSGGLSGLLAKLTQSGLASQVASWVGGGPNQAVTGDQIQSALGAAQITEIASKLGITPQAVSSQLAHVLPSLINHVTPDGKLPESGALEQGLALLKGKLFG